MDDVYYSPGGGLLKMERDLTDEERMAYVNWLETIGLTARPEDIVVEDGRVVIKRFYKKMV